MARRRLFWFGYHRPSRRDREVHPSQMRDGEAALCLADALVDHGFRFESPICNYPSEGPDLIPFDMDMFDETDLILLATRPPMHDKLIGDRRGMDRSFTVLEETLFQGPLRMHFERCARSEVLLTHETARISAEIAARQSMLFRQNGGAGYQSYGAPCTRVWPRFERGETRSAAFLVYAEHAWPGGPAFLAAFGMGGTETLGWAYLLRTRFADLLCTTPFAMVELRPRGPKLPQTLDFVESWDAELLGQAGRPRSAPRVA